MSLIKKQLADLDRRLTRIEEGAKTLLMSGQDIQAERDKVALEILMDALITISDNETQLKDVKKIAINALVKVQMESKP